MVIWNRDANIPRLIGGGIVLLLSLLIHEYWAKAKQPAHQA